MVVLGGGAVSYERGTPVAASLTLEEFRPFRTGQPRPQENAHPPSTPLGP